MLRKGRNEETGFDRASEKITLLNHKKLAMLFLSVHDRVITMRILIMSLGRLVVNGSAGNTVMCGLVQSALARGWSVSYLALVPSNSLREDWEIPFDFGTDSDRLSEFQICYSPLQVGKLRRFESGFNQAASVCFSELKAGSLFAENYDAVVAFESLAVSLLPEVSALRKLVILGDPAGKRLWHSSTWFNPVTKLKALLLGFAETSFFSKLQPDIGIAMFGAEHARFWQGRMRRSVMDLRPFLPDTILQTGLPDSNKTILYFGGTLASTASKQSIDIISKAIVPALLQRFGEDGVELRLVGDCSTSFREAVQHLKSVKIVGRVDSFEAEIAKGDIFILPMNYPVGVRTRICAALAAGNVCLAHPSVLKNMPELKSCPSILFVDTAEDYVNQIADLPSGEGLLAMRKTSRDFFESHYIAPVASGKLLDSLMENA